MSKTSHYLSRTLYPIVNFEGRALHLHRRSQRHDPRVWTRYHGAVLPEWRAIAREKNHRIHARLRDKNHLALECMTCGALTAHRVFSLRTANIRCEQCASSGLAYLARSVGLQFLRKDPVDRHYAFYRARCGHEVRRQTEFLRRMLAGETALRCETCFKNRERAEAEDRGWRLLGADPSGASAYRLYRHHCGHKQRITINNMRYGQCDCARCGESWSSKPSFLYVFRVRIPDKGFEAIKFGYSGRPEKRLRHQLALPKSAKSEVLRKVPIATGHQACQLEKAAHVWLKTRFPEHVTPPEKYADVMNVTSEIYSPALLPGLLRLLDRIERLPPKT